MRIMFGSSMIPKYLSTKHYIHNIMYSQYSKILAKTVFTLPKCIRGFIYFFLDMNRSNLVFI